MGEGLGIWFALYFSGGPIKRLGISLLIIFLFPSLTLGGERSPIKPSPKDKCPVCGMFVAKYPDWISEIIYKDGSYVFFDGTKDLFKYYLNLKRYSPRRSQADIDAIYVTDYYDLTFIDGNKAYYVIGSDVYGPMGRELVPFKEEAAAREFMKDHKGKSILRFHDVTLDIVKGLD